VSSKQIKHFLIVYDIERSLAQVEPFELDHDAALAAYAEAEARFRDDANVEVVLLGSDSRETLERTHASYFELGDNHVDRVVGRELLQLGLR
jgi:hypothetical protein